MTGFRIEDSSLATSARAIQCLRCHAADYNLDKDRIACYGSSAGAGTSI